MNITSEQREAIAVARRLIAAGIPVFAARPALDDQGQWVPTGGTGGCGYWLPNGWERTVPTENWLNPNINGWSEKAWRPGWALGAVMGHGLDLLDIDPRNGGDETAAGLKAAGMWPRSYASAATPSGGTHDFVASMYVGSRDHVRPGFDVKGGAEDGSSRGFAFIAPTLKASKTTGELQPYVWTCPPDLESLDEADSSVEGIAELVRQSRASHKERDAPASGSLSSEPIPPQQAKTYIEAAVRSIQDELRACAGQDELWQDDKGRGWEKITADAAYRLGALARADWNELTLDEARAALLEAAPTDSGFTRRDVEEKWRAQYARAEPAKSPAPRSGDDIFGPASWTTSAPPAPLSAHEAGAEPSPASWAPADLTAFLAGTHITPKPTLLVRTDGQALLYPGLVHSFHGESESGKSLVLQMLTAELLAAGRKVAFIDFESDVASVCGRLLLFGATREGLRDHLDYIKPEVSPGMNTTEQAAWTLLMQQRYDLVVIDGVTDALSVFGKATKDNDDITAFTRAFPKQVAQRTGAAVVMVDHVTKDTESRGRYAIGGQAKMNGLTGAAYVVEIDEALGKGLRGVIVLRVGKDRPGEIRQACGPMRKSDRTQEAARIVVDSRAPERPVWTVEPWRDSSSGATAEGFRPTALMEAACLAVERNAGVTKNGIVEAVGKNKRFTMQAIDQLVTEGFLRRETGGNNSQRHYVERIYRQATDPLSSDHLGSGTTEVVHQVVCGSSPYTGGAGTTLSVVPEPLSEPPGTTAQEAHRDLSAEHGPCSICHNPTRKYGANGLKHCDACRLSRQAGVTT